MLMEHHMDCAHMVDPILKYHYIIGCKHIPRGIL